MVRKRVDADFCCDEHREKYHARTRRSIETLREADEHIAVRRRLNEGIPLRPSADTEMHSGSAAGKLTGPRSSLPAAATTTQPCWRASWTAD